MTTLIKDIPKLPGGIFDTAKIHSMFYEAAFWRVQAQASHIESASAFNDDFNTMAMCTMIVAASPIASPVLLQKLGEWGTTQTVESGDFKKNQHNTQVLTHDMCQQFWRIMSAQGTVAAQAYAHGQEALRNDARNKVIAMVQAAGKHDMELARQAENTRKSLIVVLTACEVAMIAIGFIITSPFAFSAAAVGTAGSGGVLASLGVTMGRAVWYVYGISVTEAVVAKLVGADPTVWKCAAVVSSASSKRALAFHIYGKHQGWKLHQIDKHFGRVETSHERLIKSIANDSKPNFRTNNPNALTTETARQENNSRLSELATAKNSLSRTMLLQKATSGGFLLLNLLSEAALTHSRWNE